MADTKINSVGERQPVDEKSRYAEMSASEMSRELAQPLENTGDNKRAIQSKVFDKISTVRRRLEKRGEAVITVYDATHKYTVRLCGPNKDYEYDIMDIEEIK